jgi:hypothetical protein
MQVDLSLRVASGRTHLLDQNETDFGIVRNTGSHKLPTSAPVPPAKGERSIVSVYIGGAKTSVLSAAMKTRRG